MFQSAQYSKWNCLLWKTCVKIISKNIMLQKCHLREIWGRFLSSNWKEYLNLCQHFVFKWAWYWCYSTSLSATWIVGLNATSASLHVTQSCVVWLTSWRERKSFRFILTGSRVGPVQTTCGSTRPSASYCTWVRAIPNINTGWLMCGLSASLQRRTWGSF